MNSDDEKELETKVWKELSRSECAEAQAAAERTGLRKKYVAVVKRQFDECDMDKDGSLDATETRAAVIQLARGQSVVERVLKARVVVHFAVYDKNSDGLLEFEEFLELLKKVTTVSKEDKRRKKGGKKSKAGTNDVAAVDSAVRK